MKFAQIAIGSILFIEAALLLYSPQSRFNFHSFVEFSTFYLIPVKQQTPDCQCWHTVGYQMVEQARFLVIALIAAGAYSLTLGSNILVGILAQLLWTVIQSQLYYEQGVKQVKNTLIQFLFLVILVGDLRSEWRECKKQQQQRRKQESVEQQKNKSQPEVSSSNQPAQAPKSQQSEKPKGQKGGEKQGKKSK